MTVHRSAPTVSPTALAPYIYWATLVRNERSSWRYHSEDDTSRDLWQRCCYNLWRCLQGTVLLERGGRTWTLRPGRVGLCEPGMVATLGPAGRIHRVVFDLVHRDRVRTGATYTMRERTPQPSWEAIFGRPLPVVVAERIDRESGPVIDGICNAPRQDPVDRLRAQTALGTLLLGRLAVTGDDGPATFADRVDGLLRRHLRSAPTLADIAERLGVSRHTLFRAYVAERGIPPSAGLDRIRLVEAMAQLGRRDHGSRRAHAAAVTRCGFADGSSFARWFRRRTGQAPSIWRREQLARDA